MDCDSVGLWVRVGEGKSSRLPCSLVGVTRCGSGFEEVVSLCQCPCSPNAFSGLPYPSSPKVTIMMEFPETRVPRRTLPDPSMP